MIFVLTVCAHATTADAAGILAERAIELSQEGGKLRDAIVSKIYGSASAHWETIDDSDENSLPERVPGETRYERK